MDKLGILKNNVPTAPETCLQVTLDNQMEPQVRSNLACAPIAGKDIIGLMNVGLRRTLMVICSLVSWEKEGGAHPGLRSKFMGALETSSMTFTP